MSTEEARELGAETAGEILAHYGVKGMRWGVRRSRKERRQAQFGGKQQRKPSEDHVYSRKLKKKKTFELSNQELKALNERLQLESRKNQLDPSIVDKGHKTAKNLLAISATATTALALRKPVIDLGKQIIKYDDSWV